MKSVIFCILYSTVICSIVSAQHWGKLSNGLPSLIEPKDLFGDSISNRLYSAGIFPELGFTSQRRVMSWNGIQWSPLGPVDSTTGNPQAIIQYNDNLFLTGSFSQVGEAPAKNIATWNGTNWNSMSDEPNQAGYTLNVINGELYLGGVFDSIGSTKSSAIAKWNGTQWQGLVTGIAHTPDFPPFVFAIAEYHGKIYAGGNFDDSTSGATLDLLRFNGSEWENVPGWVDGPNSFVNALAVYHDDLYVGGQFFKSEGSLGNHIVKWNDTLWTDIGPAGYTVRELLVYHDELYACGDFSDIGGIPANHIAKWNGNQWCNLGSDYFNGGIFDMTKWHDSLYISGGFTTIASDTFNFVAKWLGGDYTDSCSIVIGISEINKSNFNFSLTPNPATTKFQITIANNPETSHLTILNLLGQQLSQQQFSTSQISIGISFLPVGIYFIEIQNEKQRAIKKFVKQ